MGKKVLCIVNPNVKDTLGHYFEYAYCLVGPARKNGYEPLLLAHKDALPVVTQAIPTKKVFTREIWHTLPYVTAVPKIGRSLNTWIENVRFYRLLRSVLDKNTVDRDWVVFCDMICQNQILAWGWWLKSLPKDKAPRLVLLFRYSADWFDFWFGRAQTSDAFRSLGRANHDGRIRLCSDSARLAKDYSRFTDMPIEVFPIPHTVNPILERPPSESKGGKLTFLSIGGARDEKGIFEILKAIKILNGSGQGKRFSFVIQSNGAAPDVRAAIEDIKKSNFDNLVFVDKTLSTEEYYLLLQSSDVVLVPYWRSIYTSRTSGIFTESLAAGKPVITTEDTWMSDQLEGFGAGLLCKDRDPEDLARRMVELCSDYRSHADKAGRSKGDWTRRHNPDALMAALLGKGIR